MAAADLVTQATDGTLLHGAVGERIVNHYSFYTAFQTPEEWRLVASGRTLGTLPISRPFLEGELLIFAGRRWKIVGIDPKAHIVELAKAAGGVPPKLGGEHALMGDRVRAEMRNVYSDDYIPAWLDRTAAALLEEGSAAWHHLLLDGRTVLGIGMDSVVLPWVGDRALATAGLILSTLGLEVGVDGPTLVVADCSQGQLSVVAEQLLRGPALDPLALARRWKNTEVDKWDWVLDEDLAAEATEARLLDMDGALRIFRSLREQTDLQPQQG